MVCRCHPLPQPPCRPQPCSICQAPKPHSALRHEPTAGTSQLRSLRPQVKGPARTGRGPSFPTKLGPRAQSQATQREKCIQDWQDLLAQIGSCSITFVAAAASQDPYAAFEASLRAYTPSTIAQYFRCIRAFLAFIGALGFGVGDLLLVHLVDLLHACENSKLEDRSSVRIAPRPMLKALSWLARIGQIESLASLLSNPLAKAFASPQQPQERKEALPLPLAILASWERKVCAADCTHNLRIMLGAFLLAAHTSMRLGDMQRIKIKEISLTQHALRGSCWATKTTKLGQPWACTLFGLTGRSAQSSWVIKWLESLSEAVTQSISEPFSLPEPDFIMPVFACIDEKTHPKFSGPLPYTQALSLLRWAVQVPWEPRTSACLNSDEAHAYTLHSLKVALLSASAQLRLPEESRRQQGHHRINSVQLYSRDDTIESLWVQAQIAAALIRGWRPTRPQSRGGQHPVFEPLFRVDAQPIPQSINLLDLPAPLRMFTYVREQQAQPCIADPEAWAVQDIQSSDSSSAHESGEECPDEAPPPRSSLALCLVQLTTGAAVHAVYSSPEHLQSAFCTACGLGIQVPVHRIDYLGQEHLCKHNACQHAFSLMP